MLELFLAALLLGAPTSARDTIIQVREGDHLVLKGFSGAVEVEGWGRSEVRARADAEEALLFEFSRSGSRIDLEVLDRKNRNRTEELILLVPSPGNLHGHVTAASRNDLDPPRQVVDRNLASLQPLLLLSSGPDLQQSHGRSHQEQGSQSCRNPLSQRTHLHLQH